MGFLGGIELVEHDMKEFITTNPIFMGSNNNNNNNNDSNSRHLTSNEVDLHQNQLLYDQQHQQHVLFPGNHYMDGGDNNEISSSTTTGAYDLGEIDHALFRYLGGQTDNNNNNDPQDHHSSSSSPGEGGMRPPTLNIFPSKPMHIEPPSKPMNSGSKRPLAQPPAIMELSKNITNKHKYQIEAPAERSKSIKREGNRKGLTTSSSEQERTKTPDSKTLRRLAQNREAARKSRIRKKAYVQQLESSRIRLAQLEHELQRAKAQGILFGGGGGCGDQVGVTNISSDATIFDMEYTRWLEEHHRLSCELRAALLQEHIQENELKLYVDNYLAHYDLIINLKSMVAKTDVFHLVSGMWKTPAERCFLWLGGFRPSELIKIIVHQIEPLAEEQLINICGLQQTTHEAEEALSQGLHLLHQSLSDVITADALAEPPIVTNYMGQMALAMNKLSTMETFVRQADSLRHQTLHRLHQSLTTRQAARCFLAIAEYSHRLRALSSLWMGTPRQYFDEKPQ